MYVFFDADVDGCPDQTLLIAGFWCVDGAAGLLLSVILFDDYI